MLVGAVSTLSVTSRAGCMLPPMPPNPSSLLHMLPLLLVSLFAGLALLLLQPLGSSTQSYARTCSVPYSSLHKDMNQLIP